jgi:methylated-DNA-[protein]-cysteine S-methyltransferase
MNLTNHSHALTTFMTTLEKSPLGMIAIAANSHGLTNLWIQPNLSLLPPQLDQDSADRWPGISTFLQLALKELSEYFSRNLTTFTVPLYWEQMPLFQQKTLRCTLAIPYGSTRTYAQIAQEIGHPRAARAVGQAEARNPIPIIIPCHRVVGRDGKLHGYGAPGGIQTKAYLLRLEGAV